MEQDAQIVVRVPKEMSERLRAYADRLSKEVGVPVSVAAVARKLIGEGLDRSAGGRAKSGKEKL